MTGAAGDDDDEGDEWSDEEVDAARCDEEAEARGDEEEDDCAGMLGVKVWGPALGLVLAVATRSTPATGDGEGDCAGSAAPLGVGDGDCDCEGILVPLGDGLAPVPSSTTTGAAPTVSVQLEASVAGSATATGDIPPRRYAVVGTAKPKGDDEKVIVDATVLSPQVGSQATTAVGCEAFGPST